MVLLTLVASAPFLHAQLPPPSGQHTKVTVNLAPSAAEQLKQASRMWQKIYIARSPEERYDAFAETMANLGVIAKRWPNDSGAILQSAVMQADLALEFQLPGTAISALQPVSEWADKTSLYPGVHRRLGQAYEAVGNTDEAEKHFATAERSLHNARLDRVEAESVLTPIALFYARQHNPREAMKRYRTLAELPDQTAVNKAIFKLASLKQAVGIKDDPNRDVAKQELADLDQQIFEARGKALKPEDAATIESVARDAQQIRNRHRL